jgi:hemolysin III
MTKRPHLSKDGSVHVTDEFYNTLISGLGAVLAAIGSVFLIRRAWMEGPTKSVWALSIYGLALINMFLWSALHHGIDGSPRTNHHLRQFDYYAIFMMIAGSFTPFCVILLNNLLGWIVLGVIWTLAVVGIAFKAFYPHAPKWLLTAVFIGMGWLGVLIAKPIYMTIHWQGFAPLFLGGVFFTVGGLIYGLEKPNPFPGRFGFHEIWHCFVFAGAASHFFVIYAYL